MLDTQRLKSKIKEALINEQTEEESANDSLERISLAIAKAVIEEIKEAKINYSAGLVAQPGGGAVTGTLTYTIT